MLRIEDCKQKSVKFGQKVRDKTQMTVGKRKKMDDKTKWEDKRLKTDVRTQKQK